MAKLQIEKVNKHYGSRSVLRDLTWSSGAAVVGISGSNGSGKSTLLQCLSGLLRPASGRILWTLDGKEFSPGEMRSHLGFAAPYVEMYEAMTVYENLLFLWNLRRGRNPSGPKRIPRLLEQFQAGGFADKPYGELSTGQRQRTKLAASCLHEPRVLLLDEPGTNLDADGRAVINRLLKEFGTDGRMVLIASNRPEELELCYETINLDQESHVYHE